MKKQCGTLNRTSLVINVNPFITPPPPQKKKKDYQCQPKSKSGFPRKNESLWSMDKLDTKQFATNFTHFLYVLPLHAYGPPNIKEVKKN